MDLVDFHAHILPRADHGSSSVEDSLCQIKMAKECGVSRVVATPHFYAHRDSVDSFLARRRRCSLELFSALADSDFKIALGAEVLLCEGIEGLPGLDKLCIGESKTLLLELPFNGFEKSYIYSVRNLIQKGYDIILAHADRYPEDNIESLVDCGARLQLNADSLAHFFKRTILFTWIDMGLVVALGSDIHGTNTGAYKDFLKAQKKLGNKLDYIKQESDKLWNGF